jgi:hypothetical protein
MLSFLLLESAIAQSGPEFTGSCLTQKIVLDPDRIFELDDINSLVQINKIDISHYDLTVDYNRINLKIEPELLDLRSTNPSNQVEIQEHLVCRPLGMFIMERSPCI